MLTKLVKNGVLRENELGTVFTTDTVPASLFYFYVLRRRVFSDGTANWNICCELRGDPEQCMIIDRIRGSRSDAIKRLEEILENKEEAK